MSGTSDALTELDEEEMEMEVGGGEPCSSGILGDTSVASCSFVCDPSFAAAHCLTCRCKYCAFCANAVTAAATSASAS